MKHFVIECKPGFEQQLRQILETQGENAEIRFAPGIYEVSEPIRLNEENRNLKFVAEGEVRFVGGKVLKSWKPAAELPEAARFAPEARAHIVVCDLEEEGSAALHKFVSRGFGRYVTPGHSELFADGEPLNLSQYPKNNEFTNITGVPSTVADIEETLFGPLENGYYCTDERLKSWKLDADSNVWILGYWKFDWANSCEQLHSYDPATGKIMMKEPYGHYGYKTGQRIRFYNVMEEVLEPGDYYLDFASNRVFLYPKEGMREIMISVNEGPFFFLDHCENITFCGLSFEAVCGSAIEAEFTEKLHVDNCLFHNIGNYGVIVTEGHDPLIENCTIHDCGDGGVLVFSGNRCTLEPARAAVNNNHIYRIAKWTKCYQPAIYLIGVGMTARHNLIHDCPHTAIMYWGNEMTIEDNEIYRVVLETGDAGAIYTGRDYTFRGNSVSHNYIHHLGGVGFGTMGIYNDDCVSGTKMYNNYFEELMRGIMLGGGRKLVVKNNVFVKCNPAINFDGRGADQTPAWEEYMTKFLMGRFYRVERYPHSNKTTRRHDELRELHCGDRVSAMESVYIERYPELAELDEMFRHQTGDHIYIPSEALVENNVFASKLRFRYYYDDKTKKLYDRGVEIPATPMMCAYVNDFSRDVRRTISGSIGDLRLVSNYPAGPDDFEDAAWSDLRIKKDSKAAHFKHKDADFETIGLVEIARQVNPARVNMTVQFIAGDKTVRIGLRNRKDTPVSGNLLLSASKDVELETNQIAFELAGGEERFYEAAVYAAGEDAIIDVHSDVPGVRPARS